VLGSCPRQTVNLLGAGVEVGSGTGVPVGEAVASGDCEEGSPQAVIAMEKIKTEDSNVASLLDRFMGTSFFEECIHQLYKQAARTGGLLV